jgi:carbamoyl-phosphate synthase large subunit
MRVLIPSAGAASSVSVIREAKKRGHYVLATDLQQHAPGMLLADDSFVSPVCYEAEYVDEILGACLEYGVNHIIPVNDVELPVYVQHRNAFEKADIHVFMNPDACVLHGCDKMKSYAVCCRAKIRQPMAQDLIQYWHDVPDLHEWTPHLDYPMVAKPPIGVGGRDQHVFRTQVEFERFLHGRKLNHGQYMFQKYIDGTEFSVDCWGDPNTDKFVAVPRTRGKIVNGQATGGITVRDPDVVQFVRKICKAFGSTDVCCVQVIRSKNEELLYFIEFNPRYGTGVSLSFEAGIDFLDLQHRSLHTPESLQRTSLYYRAGVGMTRHWQEEFYEVPVTGNHRWVLPDDGD